jgi:hypothetical protein
VICPNNPDSYLAIHVGEGVIFPTVASHTVPPASDIIPRFQWTPGAFRGTQAYHQRVSRADLIRIGTPATVNSNCAIDEKESFRSSAPAFEKLGVQDHVWLHDESQIGVSGGQYVLAQYNRTNHRRGGTTLKNSILDDVRNQLYLARDVLNDISGVQVSFCTGVARRVPLRVLMADLMPIIAEITPHDQAMWNQLNDQEQAIQALRSCDLPAWFQALSSHQANFIDQLVGKVLLMLEPTGVNEGGDELTLAWVYQRPPYRCFKMATNSKQNSWMRVLTDSSDCATFAYIITSCLETNNINCRGPSPCWHSTAPLLEIAVLRHNLQPSIPLGPLEHKKTYFFKKMDSLLQVAVERQPGSSAVSLYVSPSSIPAKFRQRLYNMERMRSQVSRIRERRESDKPGAEAVTILTKADLRT